MNESHLTESQLLGKSGEEAAAEYLSSIGYKIIERNWVCGKYEVDIICVKGSDIIFVEVKSHSINPFFDIKYMVNKEKQRKIIYSADKYVKMHRLNMDARFDIIEILHKENGAYEISHTPNAFTI